MTPVALLANNGAVAGGEVMLLQIALGCRSLGVETVVVAPDAPGEVADLARRHSLSTVALPAPSKGSYMRAIRRWARRVRCAQCPPLLWCIGLVPAAATAGLRHRIVHFHQQPHGAQRLLATAANRGASMRLAPSRYMSTALRGTVEFPNWVPPPARARARRPSQGAVTLGFLGRTSVDKGLDVLALALARLNVASPGRFRLVVGGEPRFVPGVQRRAVERALSLVEDHVVQLGWVDRESFFEQIDLAIVPSRWAEPFGLVVAEAMAARVPFVISDAGALREVAGPSHPWVARAGDDVDLAQVIERAATALHDETVVEAAYQRWQAEYSPTAGLRRLEALLGEVGVR